LYRLPESVVSDRKPQFAKKLTKKLNRVLGIKTRLSISFHLQTNRQTEQINQELEQYLRFFIDYRQKLFITNYSRELRMGVNIRRKEKIEKVTKLVERMKKVQEEMER